VHSRNDPFGLPRHTVRAVLTLVLVAITAAVLFVPTAGGNEDVRSMFVLLTGIAVRDYFHAREGAAKPDPEPEPGKQLAEHPSPATA
jgi:hypothetical protein